MKQIVSGTEFALISTRHILLCPSRTSLQRGLMKGWIYQKAAIGAA